MGFPKIKVAALVPLLLVVGIVGFAHDEVPSGTIVAWFPSPGVIVPPKGWFVCDGNNGTPDLRDRFIYGTADVVEVGMDGGGEGHQHSGTTSHVGASSGEDDKDHKRTGAHSHTFETSVDSAELPPFVRLIYIMKA